MDGNLTKIEILALNAALFGDEPWLIALQKQIPLLKVIGRSYNGAGGYTDFCVDSRVDIAIIPNNSDRYPPVALFEHPDMPHGGAFIVWTHGGIITQLEANVDGDGKWPISFLEYNGAEKFTFVKIDRHA